jgi:hypothetical protein
MDAADFSRSLAGPLRSRRWPNLVAAGHGWRTRTPSCPRAAAALWDVMSLTTDVGDHQLRGAYGTHDDGNPCQTSTDTRMPLSERRALSGLELTATRCRLLASSGGLNRPDKAEVSGSSPLRPTPRAPSQQQFHACDSQLRSDLLVNLLVYGLCRTCQAGGGT